MSGVLGSVSSIPQLRVPQTPTDTTGGVRGGEAEPSMSSEISDPVLRAAFEAAYEGWARKYPGAAQGLARGHEYDAVNTYVNPRGQRICRTCGRDRMRARRKELA